MTVLRYRRSYAWGCCLNSTIITLSCRGFKTGWKTFDHWEISIFFVKTYFELYLRCLNFEAKIMEESAGILKFKLIHISALIMNFVLMGLLQIMLSYSVTFSASNYSKDYIQMISKKHFEDCETPCNRVWIFNANISRHKNPAFDFNFPLLQFSCYGVP